MFAKEFAAKSAAVFAAAIAVFAATSAASAEGCRIIDRPVSVAATDRLHGPIEALGLPHTGGHGQVIFGAAQPFVSHLPVFMGNAAGHPHNFQVLLKVDFDADGAAAYDAARAAGGLMTALPDSFDMSRLVLGYPGLAPLRRLSGVTVFNGHFEQGGRPAFGNATLDVDRVMYFQEFNHDAPRQSALTYLIFGSEEEAFALHLLSGPPDFDQILALSGVTAEPGLSDGRFITLDGRANDEGGRLRPGEVLSCHGDDGAVISLKIAAEIYCEAGEFDAVVTTAFNRARRCGQ